MFYFITFILGVAIGLSIKQTETLCQCDKECLPDNRAVKGTLTFGIPKEKGK